VTSQHHTVTSQHFPWRHSVTWSVRSRNVNESASAAERGWFMRRGSNVSECWMGARECSRLLPRNPWITQTDSDCSFSSTFGQRTVVHGLGWPMGWSTIAKVLKIWKDCVNADWCAAARNVDCWRNTDEKLQRDVGWCADAVVKIGWIGSCWLPPFCKQNLLLFIQPRWQLRRTHFFSHFNVLF